MEIRLSSRWTRVYSRVLPLFTMGGLLVGTAMVARDPYGPHVHVPGGTAPYAWLMSLAITALVGVSMWYMLGRLAMLRLGDDEIIVELRDEEVRIPLAQVRDIRGPLLGNPKRYTLVFEDETEVGQKLTFMPPVAWSFSPWAESEALVELRTRWHTARAAK